MRILIPQAFIPKLGQCAHPYETEMLLFLCFFIPQPRLDCSLGPPRSLVDFQITSTRRVRCSAFRRRKSTDPRRPREPQVAPMILHTLEGSLPRGDAQEQLQNDVGN